jgi:hypothetical protein
MPSDCQANSTKENNVQTLPCPGDLEPMWAEGKKKNLVSTDQDFVLLPMGWSPNANSIIPISDKADFKLKSEDKEDHFISIKGTIR